jgi:hypothetical protein
LQCRSQTRHRQCTPTVDNVADIERSISSLARQDNGGLVLPPDTFTNVYRKLIIGLAAEHRLLDARIATSKIHGFAAAAQSPVARVARIVASSHGLDLELTINWSNADSDFQE